MIQTSVIALFCEDIRDEKSGTISLIGVFGDNVSIQMPPKDQQNAVVVIPRLTVYIRINFDAETELQLPIKFYATMIDGTRIDAGGVEKQTIEDARKTREKGNRIAGVFGRFQINGILVPTAGRITIEVTLGEETYVAGSLNLVPELPIS